MAKPKPSKPEQLLANLKRHPVLSWVVVAGIIIIALGNFTEAVAKLRSLFDFERKPAPAAQDAPAPGPTKPDDCKCIVVDAVFWNAATKMRSSKVLLAAATRRAWAAAPNATHAKLVKD